MLMQLLQAEHYRYISAVDFMKGQVATEFFIYAGVFLIVLIATFGIVSYLQTQEITYREAQLSYEVGSSFAESVNLAIQSGRGFHTNMTFKRTLNGRPYQIEFQPQFNRLFFTITGTYGGITHVYSIIPYDYQFDMLEGGTCIQNDVTYAVYTMPSNAGGCRNRLVFYNNGTTLFIDNPRS